MPTTPTARRLRLAAAILVLAGPGLAGCGIRGDLERPPPIWGPDERSEAERAHESEGDGGREDGAGR